MPQRTPTFEQQVEEAVEKLSADYRRYCLGGDGDPEAYIERIRYLFEELQTAPERDPVSIVAIPLFLERLTETEEE